jgi:hypothetical protein
VLTWIKAAPLATAAASPALPLCALIGIGGLVVQELSPLRKEFRNSQLQQVGEALTRFGDGARLTQLFRLDAPAHIVPRDTRVNVPQ